VLSLSRFLMAALRIPDVHRRPERFVREAHEKICPYSHATRGNVPVTLEVIGK